MNGEQGQSDETEKSSNGPKISRRNFLQMAALAAAAALTGCNKRPTENPSEVSQAATKTPQVPNRQQDPHSTPTPQSIRPPMTTGPTGLPTKNETPEPMPEQEEEKPFDWGHFEKLSYNDAIKYVEQYGPEICFQLGKDARVIIVASHSPDIIAGEFQNPAGMMFQGLQEVNTYDDNTPQAIKKQKLESTELWVEADPSSLIMYAGSGGYFSGYRVFIKLGSYDLPGKKIGPDFQQTIKREPGITSVSGKINVIRADTSLYQIINPIILGGSKLNETANTFRQGGSISFQNLIGLDTESNAAATYSIKTANEESLMWIGGQDFMTGVPGSNTCMLGRRMIEVMAELNARLIEEAKEQGKPLKAEDTIFALARPRHNVIRDNNGRLMIHSEPPFNVYYIDNADLEWKKIELDNVEDFYSFVIGNQTALVRPYNGDYGSPHVDSESAGITNPEDIADFPTDVMFGTNSQFIIYVPKVMYDITYQVRVIPYTPKATAGSEIGNAPVVFVYSQLALKKGEFDIETVNTHNSSCIEAKAAVLGRENIDHGLAEVRKQIAEWQNKNEISQEEIAGVIASIISSPYYQDAADYISYCAQKELQNNMRYTEGFQNITEKTIETEVQKISDIFAFFKNLREADISHISEYISTMLKKRDMYIYYSILDPKITFIRHPIFDKDNSMTPETYEFNCAMFMLCMFHDISFFADNLISSELLILPIYRFAKSFIPIRHFVEHAIKYSRNFKGNNQQISKNLSYS